MEIISWIILRCNFNKEVAVGGVAQPSKPAWEGMGVIKGTISL